VPMKISPNGSPILHGNGLQSVRERIEHEFAQVRKAGATSLVSKTKTQRSLLSVEPAQLLPLADRAAPMLRAAEERFAQTPVRHQRHQETYTLTTPVETCEELLRMALQSIDKMNLPQSKEERHEVVE
jgi:hypothetical protein